MTEMIPAWVDGRLQPVEKLEAHLRGLRHKAVSVFVTEGNRILIQRRAMGKYHTPGLWANTCCTHPRMDETPESCAARRLREELGITGVDLEHRGQVEYSANVGNGLHEHELVDMFRARVDGSLVVAPNPAEVMEVRWVAADVLEAEVHNTPERFTPWLRIYLTEHAALILDSATVA